PQTRERKFATQPPSEAPCSSPVPSSKDAIPRCTLTRAWTPRRAEGCMLQLGGNTGAEMKIAIMGSGGIGGYYGAMLQNGGADVTFIARGTQLEALRQNGIAVEGVKPVQLPKVKAT